MKSRLWADPKSSEVLGDSGFGIRVVALHPTQPWVFVSHGAEPNTASGDAWLVDASSGRIIHVLDAEDEARYEEIVAAAFVGEVLFTASQLDGCVAVWDLNTGRCSARHPLGPGADGFEAQEVCLGVGSTVAVVAWEDWSTGEPPETAFVAWTSTGTEALTRLSVPCPLVDRILVFPDDDVAMLCSSRDVTAVDMCEGQVLWTETLEGPPRGARFIPQRNGFAVQCGDATWGWLTRTGFVVDDGPFPKPHAIEVSSRPDGLEVFRKGTEDTIVLPPCDDHLVDASGDRLLVWSLGGEGRLYELSGPWDPDLVSTPPPGIDAAAPIVEALLLASDVWDQRLLAQKLVATGNEAAIIDMFSRHPSSPVKRALSVELGNIGSDAALEALMACPIWTVVRARTSEEMSLRSMVAAKLHRHNERVRTMAEALLEGSSVPQDIARALRHLVAIYAPTDAYVEQIIAGLNEDDEVLCAASAQAAEGLRGLDTGRRVWRLMEARHAMASGDLRYVIGVCMDGLERSLNELDKDWRSTR